MTTVTLASGDLLLRGIPQDVQERAAAVARRAGMTLTDIARITFTRLADSGTLPAQGSTLIDTLLQEPLDDSARNALHALDRLQQHAKENGTADMTLDEINAEIAAYRKEQEQREEKYAA